MSVNGWLSPLCLLATPNTWMINSQILRIFFLGVSLNQAPPSKTQTHSKESFEDKSPFPPHQVPTLGKGKQTCDYNYSKFKELYNFQQHE